MSADTDLSSDYKAIREYSKARRSNNRDKGAQYLRDAGIAFESKNGGAHLIVVDHVDYWPGTGLWSDRRTPDAGRGVASLLRYLKRLA